MRTPEEIFKQTNELAARFYQCWGYNSKKGFRFDQSLHPHEKIAWMQACISQEELTGTDMVDVVGEIYCNEESQNKGN